jgi:hypothetical protein
MAGKALSIFPRNLTRVHEEKGNREYTLIFANEEKDFRKVKRPNSVSLNNYFGCYLKQSTSVFRRLPTLQSTKL